MAKAYDDDLLSEIFDQDGRRCYHCTRPLVFGSYGIPWARGAWEVDHANPRANGGTDRLNNLRASCIPCNRTKGARSNRAYRPAYGLRPTPKQGSSFGELVTVLGITLLIAGLARALTPPAATQPALPPWQRGQLRLEP